MPAKPVLKQKRSTGCDHVFVSAAEISKAVESVRTILGRRSEKMGHVWIEAFTGGERPGQEPYRWRFDEGEVTKIKNGWMLWEALCTIKA